MKNKENGHALKAILAHDALFKSDHPLHHESKQGVQLSIGTHACSSPLHRSNTFVTGGTLLVSQKILSHFHILTAFSHPRVCVNHSPIVFETSDNLRKTLKIINKNNRKLKGTNSNLDARHLTFEHVRSLWSEQRGIWCAVYFEAWDRVHRIITEFGWSTLS